MTTILVKNLSEDLVRQLRKLKIELGCKTWAELLGKLAESEHTISLSEGELSEMRAGVQSFLELGDIVSKSWTDRPTVLEETRRSRRS